MNDCGLMLIVFDTCRGIYCLYVITGLYLLALQMPQRCKAPDVPPVFFMFFFQVVGFHIASDLVFISVWRLDDLYSLKCSLKYFNLNPLLNPTIAPSLFSQRDSFSVVITYTVTLFILAVNTCSTITVLPGVWWQPCGREIVMKTKLRHITSTMIHTKPEIAVLQTYINKTRTRTAITFSNYFPFNISSHRHQYQYNFIYVELFQGPLAIQEKVLRINIVYFIQKLRLYGITVLFFRSMKKKP